jgi:hypothetical protein
MSPLRNRRSTRRKKLVCKKAPDRNAAGMKAAQKSPVCLLRAVVQKVWRNSEIPDFT